MNTTVQTPVQTAQSTSKRPVSAIVRGPASINDVMTCVPMQRRKAIEIKCPEDSSGFLPLVTRITRTSFLGVVL